VTKGRTPRKRVNSANKRNIGRRNHSSGMKARKRKKILRKSQYLSMDQITISSILKRHYQKQPFMILDI